MKLFYKIFAVYLLVSFILLLSVVVTVRFFAHRHFREMEDLREQEALTRLAYEFALDFQKHGNWNRFGTDPNALEDFIQAVFQNQMDFLSFPGLPPGPPEHTPFPLPGRISLFTPDKVKIAGPGQNPGPDMKFKPILIRNQTVGLIGFQKRESQGRFDPPPPEPPLGTRLTTLYVIGVILFALGGLVSYFLSRYLLAPVDKLTQGTKALTRFEFHTRIDVNTKDELGLLAADFNRMAMTLERYESMQKQWMVDISHELRTPLAILRGELEALQDGIRPMTLSRMDSLHAEVAYLESVVNDLHLLAMADTNNLTMATEPVKPVSILESVLESFHTCLEREGLRIETALSHQELIMAGTPSRLKQLFSNIIENNLKYTQKPGVITVWDKVSDQGLTIGMEDSGPGVPSPCLEKIFDRLFRLDPSRNRRGSGLGLSICKSIVDAHNGKIFASLTDKGGLRISIHFPVNEK